MPFRQQRKTGTSRHIPAHPSTSRIDNLRKITKNVPRILKRLLGLI